MLRRREERELREPTQRSRRDRRGRARALPSCASDAVLNRPQNRELSGHEGDMLLNAAYLVETAASSGCARAVDELEDRHASWARGSC